MNNITTFLFASKTDAPDEMWLIASLLCWGIFLILVGIFGKKIVTRKKNKALHKTLKKSSGWLKILGILYLLFLWFRLESFRLVSIKLWFVILDLIFVWLVVQKWKYYTKIKRRIEKRKKEYR
jgi:vacuolar-type H+-ATPase subunit I/STV1